MVKTSLINNTVHMRQHKGILPYCIGFGCNGISSVQFNSLAQLCLTLCDLMTHSTPGLPVHHQFPEFTQTHVHQVSDAIQPSHPRSSPSPPAPNPSQHQSLFQWVNSSHEVAKLLCPMVCVQTGFMYTAKQFSQVPVPIFSLARSMRVPVFLSLYLVLTVFSFLM